MTDKRQRTLELLREAGAVGTTRTALAEAGLGTAVGIHIESLRLEGHRIAQHATYDQHETTTRYVLVEDAWA